MDFSWDDLRHFLAVHRSGSLVGAGRELRADATTVGRRISALESGLGAPLFIRGRNGWTLTPAGARILPAARRAEEASADVARGIQDARSNPTGGVRLSTLEVFATRLLAPVLPDLHARHPGIRLDVLCTPRVVDLHRGEADLAMRVGLPSEESLVARRMSTATERPYVGVPWLAKRRLRPDQVTDLDGAEVLLVLAPDRWNEGLGDAKPVLRSTSVSMLLEACRAGLGVAMLPDIFAARDPTLVPLDALCVQRERPVWLVMHREMARVARVRAVADFLAERFA